MCPQAWAERQLRPPQAATCWPLAIVPAPGLASFLTLSLPEVRQGSSRGPWEHWRSPGRGGHLGCGQAPAAPSMSLLSQVPSCPFLPRGTFGGACATVWSRSLCTHTGRAGVDHSSLSSKCGGSASPGPRFQPTRPHRARNATGSAVCGFKEPPAESAAHAHVTVGILRVEMEGHQDQPRTRQTGPSVAIGPTPTLS